jgi:molybdopterin molybdotransferase
MVPFSEALRIVLEQSRASGDVRMVPLTEAFRRVLAEDITAREDIPIADNSAMDGYAVRAADVAGASPEQPTVLDVLEVLAANQPARGTVGPGQAMKIMTGAPIPPGADAIVMVEQTRGEGDRVSIKRPSAKGEHFRVAGGDIRRGVVALRAGTRLSPAHVGMLASLGYPEVPVIRRPRVGILATGDEIIPPAEALRPGKVRNSNSYTLLGLAQEAGAEPHLLGIAPDNRAALKATLERGLAEHDILITSGGVSMGDFDFVKPLADEIGVQVHFRAINIKPGKPVVFGSRSESLFFGLPGNPVSSMVTFMQLVRPAILRQMGQAETNLRTLYAPAAHALKKNDDKRHFLRAVLHPAPEGGLQVRLTGDQGSGLLSSMGYANCFVILDEQTQHVAAGQPVEVQLFDGEPLPGG